eukprot:8755372-Pyramimonas_sp.AAC.1
MPTTTRVRATPRRPTSTVYILWYTTHVWVYDSYGYGYGYGRSSLARSFSSRSRSAFSTSAAAAAAAAARSFSSYCARSAARRSCRQGPMRTFSP